MAVFGARPKEEKPLVKLMLTLSPGQDAEQLENSTRQLRRELADLRVESVDLVRSGAVPDRAKVGDTVTKGQVLVTLAASGGVLTTVIGTLQTWLSLRERQSITLEIGGDKLQVTGISVTDQQRAIDAWIARHSIPPNQS